MPGGGITGDGSIKWFMEVDDARNGFTKIDSLQGRAGRGLRHAGIEHETPKDDYFVISIEVPRDSPTKGRAKEEFVGELRNALAQAEAATPNSGARVTFRVRIQDRQSGYDPPENPSDDQYQITIKWPPVTVLAPSQRS